MTETPTKSGVVRVYTTTDTPLLQILRTTDLKEDPVLHAMSYVEECLSGTRLARDAIRAAKSAPMAGSDPDLVILLLCRWAELSCRIAQSNEAVALIQRANALLSETTPMEIVSAVTYAEGLVAGTRGNRQEQERKLITLLQDLPATSPRRMFYLWENAMFLAKQGRAESVRNDIELLIETGPRRGVPPERNMAPQFLNAIETGQAALAREYISRASDAQAVCRYLGTPFDYTAVPLLGLLETAAGPEGGWRDLRPTQAAEPAPVKVTRCLLSRQTAEALRVARLAASRSAGEVADTGFHAFSLIRAELAEGNAEAARRLVEMRQSRGNPHYLDSFFLARVDMRNGNMGDATGHFASALENAEACQAKGRLDFELALSCELSRGDILTLAQKAQGRRRIVQSAPRHAAARQPEPDVPETVVPPDRIIGVSDAIRKIREMITRFADLNAPVLITGETGTGKELVAHALHDASTRGGEPFIAVNCGSIAETLLESELFGHERGAFTGADHANVGLFQEAGTGTIFLDEMGEILPRLQRALLRVLETAEIRPVGSPRSKQVKCRILAATNADLNRIADEGGFRKDLLFRLQRLGIFIPPLRERREDILPLVRYFLDTGRRKGVHATLSDDLVQTVQSYDWPGNVRELRNVVERMRLMHSDKLSYSLDDLDLKFHMANPGLSTSTPMRSSQKDTGRFAGSTARVPLPPDDEVFFREGRSRIRRLDRIHDLFRRYRKMTRSEIVETLGISPNTATKDLQTLTQLGVIRRIEPSSSSRSFYFTLNEEKKPPLSRT